MKIVIKVTLFISLHLISPTLFSQDSTAIPNKNLNENSSTSTKDKPIDKVLSDPYLTISSLSGKDYIFPGDHIIVQLDPSRFDSLSQQDSIYLWADNIPLKKTQLISISESNHRFVFHFDNDGASEIFDLIHQSLNSESSTKMGIGDRNGKYLYYPNEKVVIRFYHVIAMVIGVFVVVFMLIWLLNLTKNTSILKDISGSEDLAVSKKPYSLSKTQLAFWLVVIISSYIVISVSKGDLAQLTGSALILLGISATTAAAGNLIDKSDLLNANITKRHQDNPSSVSFLRNILSDENGISIHRFQNVIFNIIFGLFFIYEAFVHYRMPEFEPELLTLMGISAGAYTGLKIDENKPKTTA